MLREWVSVICVSRGSNRSPKVGHLDMESSHLTKSTLINAAGSKWMVVLMDVTMG